jgi:chemotaxis protein CheD
MAVQIVSIADMKISSNAEDRLITYALGSCLGITVHDPVAGVGGMLHVMLPTSVIDPAKGEANPFMFVDTGVPRLFRECMRAGANRERLVVKAAGGSFSGEDERADQFRIGKRNVIMLRKLLWKNGVMLHAEDVGGRLSRTMALDIADGAVTLKINGNETRL